MHGAFLRTPSDLARLARLGEGYNAESILPTPPTQVKTGEGAGLPWAFKFIRGTLRLDFIRPPAGTRVAHGGRASTARRPSTTIRSERDFRRRMPRRMGCARRNGRRRARG